MSVVRSKYKNLEPKINIQELTPLGFAVNVFYYWGTILVSLILTLSISLVYIFTDDEQWVSELFLTAPQFGQISEYTLIINMIRDEGVSDRDISNNAFNHFISRLQARAAREGTGKVALMNGNGRMLNVTDIYRVSYSSNSKVNSNAKLRDALDNENKKAEEFLRKELMSEITREINRVDKLLNYKVNVLSEKSEVKRRRIMLSYQIAKGANIKDPPDNTSFLNDDFLFLLGENVLNLMKSNYLNQPLLYDDEYYNLKDRLINLKSAREILNKNLTLYSVLNETVIYKDNQATKKILVVILSMFLGFLVALCIVFIRTVNLSR